MFSGVFELMDSCQQIYVLTEKKEERNYRENAFLEEMKRRGGVAHILWLEIPVGMFPNASWKQISKQWLWSSLGDRLRERYWV